ncbi:hypothetical protein BJ508DRAFT_314146 [Ascobolus immersus RN42]|uniref:Uncharacterized protein n=1 Tax=Ascobolus immersus RN42 TaxID=1160509 RepID=A0A3N4HG71_ASCIM|nr:hypothetical protein BJ508DRAFT_314146 [Ascobolus immersus RN42]
MQLRAAYSQARITGSRYRIEVHHSYRSLLQTKTSSQTSRDQKPTTKHNDNLPKQQTRYFFSSIHTLRRSEPMLTSSLDPHYHQNPHQATNPQPQYKMFARTLINRNLAIRHSLLTRNTTFRSSLPIHHHQLHHQQTRNISRMGRFLNHTNTGYYLTIFAGICCAVFIYDIAKDIMVLGGTLFLGGGEKDEDEKKKGGDGGVIEG